jgi:hypothetical protein
MAKIGRPSIYGRPMTVNERQQRSRFMRAWVEDTMAAMERKWKKRYRRPGSRAKWYRTADPWLIGRELADSCFDWESRKPNYDRWAAISSNVQQALMELEENLADVPRL